MVILSRLRPWVLIVLLLGGCQWFEDEIRRPTLYILPEGYSGWVEIEYEVEGAPPLPIEDGHFVAEIGSDGRLVTSTPMDYGTPLRGSDEFYYRDSHERISQEAYDTPIGTWRHTHGDEVIYHESGGSTRRIVESFFVGTEEEWERWEGEPVIGPLDEVRPDPGVGRQGGLQPRGPGSLLNGFGDGDSRETGAVALGAFNLVVLAGYRPTSTGSAG